MAESFPTLDFLAEVARSAGEILRSGRDGSRTVESKGFVDVVTDIDKASEALIIGAIKARFPDHPILAEESGGSRSQVGPVWVVDPLDGTLNYLHGLPYYCVSIAFVVDGEPRLGVVYDPTRDELFAAERGRGATLNGRPIGVSATDTLRAALITTGFPYERASIEENNLREFAHIVMLVQDVRRPGAAALDLSYAAAGRTDGHWELGLKPWDIAAAVLIVAEAGGQVTDWSGGPGNIWDGHILATNGLLHQAILAEIAASRGRS